MEHTKQMNCAWGGRGRNVQAALATPTQVTSDQGAVSNAKIKASETVFFCFLVSGKKKSLSGIKKSMTKKDCQESFF